MFHFYKIKILQKCLIETVPEQPSSSAWEWAWRHHETEGREIDPEQFRMQFIRGLSDGRITVWVRRSVYVSWDKSGFIQARMHLLYPKLTSKSQAHSRHQGLVAKFYRFYPVTLC
jgi:hypothetical protein